MIRIIGYGAVGKAVGYGFSATFDLIEEVKSINGIFRNE